MKLEEVTKTYILQAGQEAELNGMLRLGWRILQLRVRRTAWDHQSPAFSEETSYLLGATTDLPLTEALKEREDSLSRGVF